MNPDFSSIHRRLRGLRSEPKGLTLVASKLGLTRAAVSAWRGKVPMEYVFEVARIAGIPAHELRPDKIPTPERAA